MMLILRFIVVSLSVILGGSILLTIGVIKRPRTFGPTGVIMFLLMIITLLGGTAANLDLMTFQQKRAQITIPSHVTVLTAEGEEIDIRLSWDVLGQDPVIEVDWGSMEQSTTVEQQFWIKNAATLDVWLTMDMANWTPPEADQVLTLRWDLANLNEWRVVNGDWGIINETLRVSAAIPRERILVREDVGFNYEISTKVKAVTSDGRPEAQIICRYRDENNYYFIGLGAYGYKAAIGMFEEGQHAMLASGGNPDYQDIVHDQWYDLRARVSGSTITVYVDGEEICSVDDTTHGFGSVGLTALHTEAVFDDFRVMDAFDPENVLFEDYFMGPPLEVGTSKKVTLFLDANCPEFPAPGEPWVFSFNIVITAWDEPPLGV